MVKRSGRSSSTSLRNSGGMPLLLMMECWDESLSQTQIAAYKEKVLECQRAQEKVREAHRLAQLGKAIVTVLDDPRKRVPPPTLQQLRPDLIKEAQAPRSQPQEPQRPTSPDIIFIGESPPVQKTPPTPPTQAAQARAPLSHTPAVPRQIVQTLQMPGIQLHRFPSYQPQTTALQIQGGNIIIPQRANIQNLQQLTPVDGTYGLGVKRTLPQQQEDTSPKRKRVETDNQGNWVPLDEFYYGKMEGDPTYSEEKNEFRFKCWYCNKMLYNNIKAMMHIQGHIDSSKQQNIDLSDLTQCKHCYRQFDTPFEMQTHVEKVHMNNVNVLMCRICERDHQSRQALMTHMRVNHNACEMPYICHLCKFRSSMYSDVVDHFKKKHDSSQHILCLYCLKVFAVKFVSQGWGQTQTYYGHLLKHQSKSNSKKCTFCRLTFVNPADCKTHKKKDHAANQKGIDSRPSMYGQDMMIKVPDSGLSSKQALKSLNAPAVSKVLDFGGTRFPYAVNYNSCVECKTVMGTPDHFRKHIECSMCRFATSCSIAYANHMMGFHSGQMSSLNLNIPWERPMKEPMHCLCGFVSRYGNKIANHLVYCTKRSCYSTKPAPVVREMEAQEDTDPRYKAGASLLDALGLVKKKNVSTRIPANCYNKDIGMEELSVLSGKSSFENKMKDIVAFEDNFERTVPEPLDEGVKINEASKEIENEVVTNKESVIETTAKEKSESEAEANKDSEKEAKVNMVSESEAATKEKSESEAEANKDSEKEAEVNMVSESEAATKEKSESEAEANKGSEKEAAGNEGSKSEAATNDDSECKAAEHSENDSEATGKLMKNTEQLDDDEMNFEISDVLVKLENLEQCGENKDFEDPCHHPNPHRSPWVDSYPQLQEDRINMRCEGITQSFLKESLPRKVQSQAKQEEFIERENVPSLQPTKAENSPTEKGKTVSDESLGTERQEEYDQRNFSTEHSNKNDFSLSNGKSNTEIPNVVNIRNSSMEKKDKTEEADNENSSTKQPDISHSRSIPTKLTNISDNLDQDSSGISTLETSNEGQKGYVSDKVLPPEENIIQGADKSSGINMQCLSDDVVEDDVSQGQGETGSSAEESAQRKLHSERKYKGHSMKENLPLLNPSNYDVGNSPPDQFASAVTESSHREETSNEDLDGEVTEDGGDDEEEDGIPSEENKKRHPSNEKEEKVDIEDDGGDNFVGVEEETMSGDYHQLEEMINRAEDNPSVDDIYNRKVMKNKDQSHSKDDVPEENRRQALDNLYGSNIPHQSHELVEDVSDDDEVDDDEGEEDDVPSQENGGKELDNLYERRNPHQSHELVEEVVSEDGNMDIYKCDNTDEKGDDEVINDDDFPSEETIVRAEDNPKIYIKKVLKSTDNSNSNQPTKKLDRVYNQKHCCFICQKMVLHLPDHLWRCHKSHLAVKEALSSNRKGRFDQIRAKGDHLHNIKVVKEGKGELILSRRRGSFNSQEFGPCPECLEWMHLKSIDIHYRKFHKHCKMFRKLKSGSTLVDKKQHTVPVSTPSAQVLQKKSVTSIEESSLTKLHSENEYEEITKKENSSSINPSQSNVGNSPRVELTSAVTESSHGGETDRNDVYNSSRGMQDVAINKNFQTKHTFVAEKELSEKQLNESDFLEPPTATVELNLSMTQQSSEDLGEDDCVDVSDDDDIDDEGEEDDVHSQENGGKELDNLYERSNPHQSHELVGEVITENNNIDVSECDDADERGEEEEEVMGDDDFPSEETIVRAEDNPMIYIKKILKSTDSSNSNQPTKKLDRVYNQKHCCFICQKMVLHLPDHLWRCHKSHLAVKEALSSNQKGRFDQIRAKGDHLHNIKVVKEGKGELILSRRRESFNSQEFGPCPECLEWMHLKSIDKHNRKFHKHCKKFRKLKSSFVDKKQHTVPVSTPSASVLQNKSVTSLEESAVTKLHTKNKFQKLSKKENSSSINPSQSDVGNSLPHELTSAETESSHGEETYRNDVDNSSRRTPDVAINQNFQTEHKAVSEKESSEKHLNERNFTELPTATVELNFSHLSMTQPSSEDLGEDVSDDVSDDDDSDEEDEDDVLSQGRKELDNLFGSSIPIQSHKLVGEVITENDNMDVSECDDADERGDEEEEVMSDDDFPSEETIVRAEDNPKIYIKKILKSTDSSNSNQPTKKLDRVYNQKHCCFLCQKMFLHLPDHLWRCHKSQPVVKEALSSNQKGRFDQIRTKGDHLHNIKVVKEGKGELILSRRPERFISKDYEPCYNCLEWMHKGTLKKHFKAVHREPKEIDSGYAGMLNVSHNTPVCTEPTQLQHNSDSVSEQVELIYSYNKKRQEPARKLDHQQWSSEEKKELELYFCDFLVKKTSPSRIQCLDIIERCKVMGGVLHMRSWQNIIKKISQENKGNGKTIETGNFPLKRKASKSKSRTKSMKISWKKAMNKSIQKSHKVLARKKSSKKGFPHKSRALSGKSNCDLSITFKRKRWTKEEERELDFYFGRYFASKTCPSKRECMKVIAKSAECGGVIHTRYWQNIIKKISSENKKNRKSVDMSTPNLHTEESEFSRTETSIDECNEKVAETVGTGQKVATSNADLSLMSTSKHEKGDSDSFSNIVERKLWSKEEVNELQLYLGEFLTTKTCPSKKRCLEAIEKSKQNGGVLQNRYWHNIIKKISTENNKKRKSVSKHIGDSDKTERTTSVFSKASNESLGKSSTSGLNEKPSRKSISGKSDAPDNICERKRWSSEEEEEIKKYFNEFLSSGTCPSKKQCLKAIEKSKQSGGTLHTRYWHNIVKKISNTNRKASKLQNSN